MTIHHALLIDDSRVARHTLNKLLERRNIHVTLAESADDGLNQLAQGANPDLILMDYLMPGRNGLETTRLLKSRPESQDIPVVLCTSPHKSEAFMSEAYQAGILDLLPKPPKAEELDAMLSRINTEAEDIPTLSVTDDAETRETPWSPETPSASTHQEEPLDAQELDQITRSTVRTHINNRLHELLGDLFDEQHQYLKQTVEHRARQQQASLVETRESLSEELDQKISQLRNDIAKDVTTRLGQQLKVMKNEWHKALEQTAPAHEIQLAGEDMDRLPVPADARLWQSLQADAMQQTHDIAHSTAVDVAHQTVEFYRQQQKRASARAYTVALGVSLGIFALGIVWIGGLFGV